MRTLYLVSCVRKKKPGSHPARDLYDSDFFKKCRRYVEKQGVPWFILSAQYGLVQPEAVISTYDKTLNNMSVSERRAWAQRVLKDLERYLASPDTVVFLAGSRYREFLIPALRGMGVKIEVPMEGLRIGEQLQWLERS
jgi:hypothetical protein